MTRNPLDHTHNAAAQSWVESANGHPEFPIQNLPLGLFSDEGGAPRAGIAIGDYVLDLGAVLSADLIPELDYLVDFTQERLNELLALGAETRLALRHAVFELLSNSEYAERVKPFLVPMDLAILHLPCEVGGYTRFENTEKGWQGRHSRAPAVVLDDLSAKRPLKADGTPSQQFDYQIEIGLWIGVGNDQGHPIPAAEADDHIAGYSLLNAWTAHDIIAESGLFAGTDFHVSASGWIVTPEALAPFMSTEDETAFALDMAVSLQSSRMEDNGVAPHLLAQSRSQPWSPQQLLTRQTANGSPTLAGDLLGVSTGAASMSALTDNGAQAISLPNGETRHYLQAGDRVILQAHAKREGFATIGFGPSVGHIQG